VAKAKKIALLNPRPKGRGNYFHFTFVAKKQLRKYLIASAVEVLTMDKTTPGKEVSNR
jgi:hypothetical protein